MGAASTEVRPAEADDHRAGAPIEATEPRRPGRPRDPQAGRTILEAAMAEIADHGFSGLTIDGVAARAGVSKATIYRRWSGKAALVLDAAATLVPSPEAPDTGSIRSDLVALFGASYLRGPRDYDAQMAGLFAEATVNEEVRVLLGSYARGRRSALATMVNRAVERGELPKGTDVDLLAELVGGALYYRSVVGGTSIDEAAIQRFVDVALRGLGAHIT
jgi:AcrR family transcriptional regulator